MTLCRRQIDVSQFLQETEKAKDPINPVNPVGQEEYQNITDVPNSTKELTKSQS